jgi:outer membrane protein assembly factor BamB
MYAFDALTGAKLWSSGYGTMLRGIRSSPAVVNGMVYVGSRDGNLYAFGLPG